MGWCPAHELCPSVIQVYVTRLRARLAPHGAKILRNSVGYLVDVHPDDVDYHEVRSVLQVDTANDDSTVRARRSASALALCRGPLLGGVDTDPLSDRLAGEYDQLRLTVLERYCEAHLACGRPDMVIAALAGKKRGRPANRWSSRS